MEPHRFDSEEGELWRIRGKTVRGKMRRCRGGIDENKTAVVCVAA
jgi:hypothetical protein